MVKTNLSQSEISMRSITFKGHHYNQAVRWVVRCPLNVLLSAIIALALAGCAAVGPDYTRVEPDAPEKWHTQLQGGLNPGVLDPETLARWWRSLNAVSYTHLTLPTN